MTGLVGSSIRRIAGVFGVVAAVALIAAPVALADTITPQATVQFSGVVDSSPSCTSSAATATISWGDGTAASAATINPSTHAVSGTHTYATQGDYTGEVDFTNDACSADADLFTADVSAAPPMFTECPAVFEDNGCQYLIEVNNGTETVLNDSNQGPYEGSDDALIGVLNNSSSPVSELPLAVPGSDLFGFDGDGICNPGGPPVPSGCAPQAGTPAGTDCTQGTGGTCAFPVPSGEPAGYIEPGGSSGVPQNGYEGPTSWFSNVSTDTSSGVVHFSPAIQPGQSTYFSLEEPPVGTTIGVGGTAPLPGGMSPPTVTSTGASFSALVNPNGQATTAYFQYGLDLKYSKFGGSGPDYTNSTPVQSFAGNFTDDFVNASVSGLVPNALYHVRLVATNAAGTTFGPDMTFTTTHGGTPGSPTLGKTFNVSTVSGLVLVKVHGVFIPLTELTQIPKNTVINALHGTLSLTSAVPGGSHPAADVAAKGKKHKGGTKTATQQGNFGGAIFKISQATGGANKGQVTLTIVENAFKGAPSYSLCTKHTATDATVAKSSSKTLQLLHASAKGKFTTKGRYGAATVLGTKWTISDRCDGTLIHDVTDSVQVTDFVHHKTITLHAGQSYLATKP
ncbi:MAG: hypothetical protein ACLP0L_09025 [Solirubrobacteraceae bacterium]